LQFANITHLTEKKTQNTRRVLHFSPRKRYPHFFPDKRFLLTFLKKIGEKEGSKLTRDQPPHVTVLLLRHATMHAVLPLPQSTA